MIGESGFKARVGRNIVSGYSGVCFEIKFLGRYIIGFDVINNNGILRAMHSAYASRGKNSRLETDKSAIQRNAR